MEKYQVKCEHCGQMFEANRKDTKYCSDSCRVMASRDRKKETEPDQTIVLIKYSPDEYKKLQRAAKSAGISVNDMVKFRGLMTLSDVENRNKEIEALKNENVRLKAHLSVYTKKPSSGIFLPADEFDKGLTSGFFDLLDIFDDLENPTLENKISYLSMHCLEFVDSKYFRE